MVTFSFGIAFGVVIGLIAIKVGQISIGLGSAGGLLVSGLAIGYLRSISPTFGRMPDAACWILMEFGLLLFMAGVGLRAGGYQSGKQLHAVTWLYRCLCLCQCFANHCRQHYSIFLAEPGQNRWDLQYPAEYTSTAIRVCR